MAFLFFYLFFALFIIFICSILEAVLLSITPAYIGSLVNEDLKNRMTLLKTRIDDAISSISMFNTIAHTMGAAGVGAEVLRLFGSEWQSAAAAVLTLLILYVSEIIPKTIGATYWRELARPSAFFIRLLMKLFWPMIWLSSQLTSIIKKGRAEGLSREEIVAMTRIGKRSGVLEKKEERLIVNLLHLKEVTVGDIMTPRSVVFSLDASMRINEAVDEPNIFVFSRIPVYDVLSENIVGQVFSRKILRSSVEEKEQEAISTIMRPLYRVPETMPVYYLIDMFITRKEHLFAVHDNEKHFSGIVTLEDAIETFLGVEIVDEADQVTDMRQLVKEYPVRQRDKR